MTASRLVIVLVTAVVAVAYGRGLGLELQDFAQLEEEAAKAKKYKHNRASFLFKGGVCESLLHIPAFIPSPTGPQPILLLSLENKLKENEVIATPPGVTKIYTEQDEETAKFLAQDFRDRLLDDMKLLDMIR